MKIRFSILIPVYNAEKYLPECIDSVLNQTYQNFEIILVDDGSTDNSGNLCDEYADKYPFIKVFHKSNGGQLSARCWAIEKATGDWFVFLDSDDSLQPETLQVLYDKIQAYDCDCIIYGWQRVWNGKILDKKASGFSPDSVITDKRELYSVIFNDSSYNSLCRKACKACLFDGRDYSGFYSVKHGEDLLQSIEILENSNKTVILDKPLYNYTYNPDSISNNMKLESVERQFFAFDEVIKMLERQCVFDDEDFVKLYNNRLVIFLGSVKSTFYLEGSYHDKISALDKLKNSLLYQRLLLYKRKGKLYKSHVFELYIKGKYKTLFGFCELRKYLSIIKRMIIK